MDGPQIRSAPGAIVAMVNDHTPHFVLETPKEVREKRAILKEEQDLGLGEGGEADESGLLNLVGLDLYGDGDVEPYDLAVHPAWVLTVKQVTPRAWEAHQKSVGIDPETGRRFQEVEERRLGDTPKMILFLQAAGVEVNVVGPGLYYVELDSAQGEMQATRHMLNGLPLLSEDANGDEVCCCGHPSSEHVHGSKVVEGCGACNVCGVFHRHPEEEDESDERVENEEQPTP